MIDELIKQVREGFKSIKDHRGYNSTYSLSDLLSAGFAIFSLKDPSLSAFREQFPQRIENLKAMPQDRLLLTLDALYANAPLVRLLKEEYISFLIGIKEGYVLVQTERLAEQGALKEVSREAGGRVCAVRFANDLILNGQNQDLLVNYLEYVEVDAQSAEVLFFSSWITDLAINEGNAADMVIVARTRWKIENETFNTLKNQGYYLEHNFGHGKQYLATNFAILTFLAFLTDQIAQCLDTAFQKALAVYQTKRAFWEKVRQVFDLLPALSMNAIYRFIAKNKQLDFPLLE